MACPNNKLDATTEPDITDDSCNTSGNGTFENGSFWFDTVTGIFYMLIDDTCGAAVWEPVNQKEQLTFFEAQLDPLAIGGTQNIPFNTETLLDFDVVVNDNPNDVWDAVAKSLTIDQSGIYIINCSLQAIGVTNSTGGNITGRNFAANLHVNGQYYHRPFVVSLGDMIAGQVSAIGASGSITIKLDANDVLKMYGFHTYPAPISFDLNNNIGAGIGLIPRTNSWTVKRIPELG